MDEDTLRNDLARLPADLDNEVDRAGRTAGQRFGRSLGDSVDAGVKSSSASRSINSLAQQVETLSQRVTRARQAEKDADGALQLAELRLSEARDKGNVSGSRLLSLEQALERSRARVADTTSRRVQLEQALGTAIREAEQAAGPAADKAGQDSGDRLARGMNQAITRNSPLILAAVSGALVAGAPVAVAGATALFIGIGAVAAAQSQKVRSAWAGTFDQIKAGAQQDASVLENSLVRAASRIGAGFEQLRPQFRQAFSVMAPEIDGLTTSLVRAAQSGIGGMLTAIERSQPVMAGLGTLLEHVGSGVGQFFTIVSQHGPEAGQALAAIGTIVQELLVILAQLMSSGSVLGSVILPALADILKVVASALQLIAPVLPAIVAGFAAMKIAQSVSGWLKGVTDESNLLSRGLKSAADAVPGLTGALPLIGAGLALLLSAYAQAQQQQREWAQSLLDGGRAAETAAAQMKSVNDFLTTGATGWYATAFGVRNMADAMGVGTNAMDQAKKTAKELYDAMSPLQQKQQDVTTATNNLEVAISTYGSNSGQAVGAAVELRDKQEALARAQEDLERATHGVTQAMVAEWNQALAMADSNFALQRATLATKDAQDAMNKAIREHGKASEEAQKATLDFDQALLQQAEAAGKAAADTSGLTDKTELQKVQQAATLQSLLQLKDQYGSAFPAALQQSIDRLQAAGVKLDWLGDKKPDPTVDLNTAPFDGKAAQTQGEVNNLNGQRPQPIVTLNNNPFNTIAGNTVSYLNDLNSRRAYPAITAIAYTAQAEQWLDYVARNRTVVVNVIGKSAIATGGLIGRAAGAPGFAGGGAFFSGRITGPGGPTDDLVNAVNELGQPLKVSNEEWVIKGSSSNRYGPARMSAVNDGTATVLLPGERHAAGGGPSSFSADRGAVAAAGGIRIDNLTIKIDGTFDLASSRDLRKAGLAIREVLRQVDREQS